MNVGEASAAEGRLQMSDRNLPQQQHQQESPASTFPAPWPPPLPAERVSGEGCVDVDRNNWLNGSCGDDEDFGHWVLTVGKVLDDVGQDESAWERAGIVTGWLFSSFVGGGAGT